MMIHLLKAELYQLMHRRSTKVWLITAIFLSASIVIIPYLLENYMVFEGIPSLFLLITYAEAATSMSFYFLLGLAVTAFNNANKNRILVNSVSFGISRSSIYMVKYFSTLLLAFLFLLVSIVTFGIAMQFLYSVGWQAIGDMVINDFIPYLPIWLAYIALYVSLLFISDNAMPLITLMIILVMSPLLIQLLSFFDFFKVIRPYLLTEVRPDRAIVLFGTNISAYIALIYALLFGVIGLFLWNRKEIK